MYHIKIIFSDFNLLIWFSSDNRVYKESFISEDLEKTLLKYLNLIYKEKQETLTKSFIKSLKKMINIENGVMTINQNRTWYRQVNDIDYKKIKTLFLNNFTNKPLVHKPLTSWGIFVNT